MPSDQVFITGGTGYMGRRLIPVLLARGHDVRALVRPGSESSLPTGAAAVVGDVFSADSYERAIPRGGIVIHLVGTPRPSPSKAAEFERVDFAAARECIAAGRSAGARHFVYVSVAHPAPVMRAYVGVRRRVEALLAGSGMPHTILRPWYVLGPGHRWPMALVPLYWLAGAVPSMRDGARRLGLVTLPQMIAALAWAVDTARDDSRVLGVPDIRKS